MATEVLPDTRALRIGRRERALAQMQAHDLDILVLGRQANIRYVTGAPQLWIAGTRPFGPMCVVVRATGDIYLNSTDDEGIPEEIGHDHLYGLAWNPMTLIDVLKKVDGAEAAPQGRNRRDHTDFRHIAARCIPQCRTRRRGARHARRAAHQDIRRNRGDGPGAAHRRTRTRHGSRGIATGRIGADTGRRSAGGHGRGRGEHAGHPGCRVGDVGRTTVASGEPSRCSRAI